MQIKVHDLREGYILKEDVYSLTNRPIVKKETVLTNESIKVLKAFFIEEVVVEPKLGNGMPILETKEYQSEELSGIKEKKEKTFSEKYLESVENYKQEFRHWQSGLPMNLANIRNIILPLVEVSKGSPLEIFRLNRLLINDEYLFHHSVAVGLICAFLGKKLKFGMGDIVQVAVGGCLSDAGMAKVPPAILNKSTPLTPQEFEEIKKHPAYSYQMVQNEPLLREETKIGIFQHHERLDGSGYPFGLKSTQINEFAKIIAVADTFHAMTCNRLYRTKQSPFKVLEMMIEDNFGKYDFKALQAISSGIITFSKGNYVKLSNGLTAEILFIDEKLPTRPLVKIISTEEIIHLGENRKIYIEEEIK